MDHSRIEKKERLLLTLFMFLIMMGSLIRNFPLYLPEENKLQYTTGVFDIYPDSRTVDHVALKRVKNSHDKQVFACSYSPLGNGNSSSCGGLRDLTPYIDKEVTVGWYETEALLGVTNRLPQLVTIEVDGEVRRSYANTAATIDVRRRDSLYIYLPLYFPLTLLIYWFLGKLGPAEHW